MEQPKFVVFQVLEGLKTYLVSMFLFNFAHPIYMLYIINILIMQIHKIENQQIQFKSLSNQTCIFKNASWLIQIFPAELLCVN